MKKVKQGTVDKKKRRTHKNRTMIFFKVLMIAIFIICLAILSAKLIWDKHIYDRLNALDNSSVLEFKSYIPRVFLSSKNVNLIKQKNILVSVKYDKDNIVILPENICKNNNVKIAKKTRRFDEIQEINGYDVLYVEQGSFAKVVLSLPKNLVMYSHVDIYLLNEDGTTIEPLKLMSQVEDGMITIDNPIGKNKLGYIVTHIPVKDITVKNLNEGVIGIGKGEKSEIGFEVIPSNATLKNIKVASSNEEIVSVEEDKALCGNNIGDATITVSLENVSKEYNVHVSNPVKAIILNTASINLNPGGKFEINYSVQPEDAENKEVVFEIEDTSIATIEGNVVSAASIGSTNLVAKSPVYNISTTVSISVTEKPSNSASEASGLTYVNGILIANKTYSLPKSYNPGGLTKETMAAFNTMKAAAAKEGINLWIASGFRSYETQDRLYHNYVAGYGQESADTFSARPGHSEHQTGLAMDVNNIEDWFGDTKEGKWLAANSYKYGFIIRYPKSKEAITGYKYEPWHIRYLGTEIATAVYNSGLCLEEYLNITSKYAN